MQRNYTDEDRERANKSAERLKKNLPPRNISESKKETTPEDRKKNMDRLKSHLEKAAEDRKKTSENSKSSGSYFTKFKNMIGSVISTPKQQ
jgi:hypothetical protein